MKRAGVASVPILDVDGEIIVGFNKDAISKALNIQG